jgi:hypothetical protein
MTEIVNPYRDRPFYITNGQPKREILQSIGISVLAYPGLLHTVNTAEQQFDESHGIGLITTLENYPYHVVATKAEAGKKWLEQSLDNKPESLQLPFGKDNSFVVSDTVWLTNGLFVNKPKLHQEGAIIGVREIKRLLLSLSQTDSGVIGNETSIAKFGLKEDPPQFYRFKTRIGKVNPSLTETQLRLLTEMVYRNRDTVAAGLDLWECLKIGIIVPDNFISLCLNMFEGEISYHKGILLSRDLDSQQLNEEATNFLKGWWLGIISPDYNL